MPMLIEDIDDMSVAEVRALAMRDPEFARAVMEQFFLPRAPEQVIDHQVVEPSENGVHIPVDKTKFKIKFANETENHVDVVIERKECP